MADRVDASQQKKEKVRQKKNLNKIVNFCLADCDVVTTCLIKVKNVLILNIFNFQLQI